MTKIILIRTAPSAARVGADVIHQNQRELFPPESDDDEGPSELYDGVPDHELENSVNSREMSETQPEITSTTEDILQNLSPKQRIAWRVETENWTRDRFFELRNNLHLVDNTKIPADCKDVFLKVRPIYDAVRNRCLELPLEQELCVDEQIVPFTGKHVAKQYIKGKPCPWGLKILFFYVVMARLIFQTSAPELDSNIAKNIGYGASIVVLAKRIGEIQGHELYFNNYFSSYHLLQILKQKGMAACRFVKPPFLSDKETN
ncbi:unnamed protein product [Pieris brassicae]|uniref:PiggyBac transposable element-derived protein domain-containing protein n=1 Tax=Pieris brassicae TaxID=7116 RepID=A0A9P0TG23_PIEBR|nr:unnamed protein product [Pieris brassicae]